MLITHFIVAAVTAAAFVYMESIWPAPQFKKTYGGKPPYRYWLVWLCGITCGLIWPFYWVTAGIETILEKNGNRVHTRN